MSEAKANEKNIEWKSVEEFFLNANNSQPYIILRNFEEIGNGIILLEGHEDIDFLCADSKLFIEALGIKQRYWYKDKIHGIVKISGKWVKVDIREVGDRYYDENFEKNMLENRVLNENGYYIPCDEDYFYSLIYHSILQKKAFAKDYEIKLNKMKDALIHFKDDNRKYFYENDFLEELEIWLKEHEYQVVYPLDSMVPISFNKLKTIKPTGKGRWLIEKTKLLPYKIIGFFVKRMKK